MLAVWILVGLHLVLIGVGLLIAPASKRPKLPIAVFMAVVAAAWIWLAAFALFRVQRGKFGAVIGLLTFYGALVVVTGSAALTGYAKEDVVSHGTLLTCAGILACAFLFAAVATRRAAASRPRRS